MDFLDLEPPYHHFSHHEQLSTSLPALPTYVDAQAIQSYAMSQQTGAMMPMGNPVAKANETKPRLGKDEVDILEREFQKNPKPSTQTKRGFAENMGVELARINNWFQNRRAKRKQEKKQEAFRNSQAQEPVAYSDPDSPDMFDGPAYFAHDIVPLQHAATFPLANGPPPAAAPYNPQYENPAHASLESLHRTLATASAAQSAQHMAQQPFQPNFPEHGNALTNFGPAIQDSVANDRAQFPAPEGAISPFDNGANYSFSGQSNVYPPPSALPEPHSSPADEVYDHTPRPFSNQTPLGPLSTVPQLITTFPSQHLPPHNLDVQPPNSSDGGENQSPESSDGSLYVTEFKYDIQESEESLAVPPPSFTSFRSPPPMDIASRRNKAKPAALRADTFRGRPQMGPRTVSHAEGSRRQSDSPLASPMRRIVSAGGNRSGMSGRIQKPGIESAQRSPINLGGFSDANAFLEHNYSNIRNAPALTAGSSLNSSLAPPTPLSPSVKETDMPKVEASGDSPAFVFNGNGAFTAVEGEASPPETPQNLLGINLPANGSYLNSHLEESGWYDVPDEPLYTPAQDTFALELQMPQPMYLNSHSQPMTPAFGQFQPNFMLNGESPQLEVAQPSFMVSNQGTEYAWGEPQASYSMGLFSPPAPKQKSYQFSNSTPADFSEK